MLGSVLLQHREKITIYGNIGWWYWYKNIGKTEASSIVSKLGDLILKKI